MSYVVVITMVVQLISAAKHDNYLLKEVHLPQNATLAIDRIYIDYEQFQRLTEEGNQLRLCFSRVWRYFILLYVSILILR